MKSDFTFSKRGRFQIVFKFEMSDGKFMERPIIIDGKPEGKILINIEEGVRS